MGGWTGPRSRQQRRYAGSPRPTTKTPGPAGQPRRPGQGRRRGTMTGGVTSSGSAGRQFIPSHRRPAAGWPGGPGSVRGFPGVSGLPRAPAGGLVPRRSSFESRAERGVPPIRPRLPIWTVAYSTYSFGRMRVEEGGSPRRTGMVRRARRAPPGATTPAANRRGEELIGGIRPRRGRLPGRPRRAFHRHGSRRMTAGPGRRRSQAPKRAARPWAHPAFEQVLRWLTSSMTSGGARRGGAQAAFGPPGC